MCNLFKSKERKRGDLRLELATVTDRSDLGSLLLRADKLGIADEVRDAIYARNASLKKTEDELRASWDTPPLTGYESVGQQIFVDESQRPILPPRFRTVT